jgi:uncharacterized membrane protein YtjA (UPF0391 family)
MSVVARRSAGAFDRLRRVARELISEWVRARSPGEEKTMLWTLIVLLLVFWLLGFAFNVAGGIIHVLLVIAVVLFVVNLLTGRRTVV